MATSQGWSWKETLYSETVVAVPVRNFSHAPLGPVWNDLAFKDMKVEVPTKLCPGFADKKFKDAFWICEVKGFAGYYLKLKFLSLGEPSAESKKLKQFWAHWNEVFPVGYCKAKSLELVPPQDTLRNHIIEGRSDELQDLLYNALIATPTKHQIVPVLLENAITSIYAPGDKMEIQNDALISEMKLGKVVKTCGRRVFAQFHDYKPGLKDANGIPVSEGFWLHEKADQLRPLGWSREIGHKFSGPENSKYPKLRTDKIGPPVPAGIRIEKGMKLEAIDPICPADICAASVTKVLRHGYFMIKIDSVAPEGDAEDDWFCVHITSHSIFKCGFCKKHDIPLKPPIDYEGSHEDFDWKEYLASKGNKKGMLNIVHDEIEHEFKVGSKLEAVDLVQSTFVCPATVIQVAGRLIRIRFCGWDENFDQFHDVTSPDLFPVGWCALVGHLLTPPKNEPSKPKTPPKKSSATPRTSTTPAKKEKFIRSPPIRKSSKVR